MNFSIVVPTYCRSEDLSRLFDSLMKLTIKPVEVILVDDTPTDEIRNLWKEQKVTFDKEGIKLLFIKNPRDRSAAIARNVGVTYSGAQAVLFIDSDVTLFPNYIEEILKTFKKHPDAVGVQGWILNQALVWVHPLIRSVHRIFSLSHFVRNSCKLWQYPNVLDRTINCEYLSGANMTIKKSVLSEIQFDEKLKEYSYMEDVLLSYSLYRKYPHGLYITPDAKCIHATSKEGRIEGHRLRLRKNQCRKYVLKQLFAERGLLLYYWQNIGYLILDLIDKTKMFRKEKP